MGRTGVVLLLVSLGCGEPPGTRADDCTSAVEAGQHARVVEVCAWEHERSGDLAAAEAAMRAHFTLGHDEQTLRWSERLQPTERAATAWAFAALVHQRNQRCPPQIDAYERARQAYVARGELVKAARAAEGKAHCYWIESDLRQAFEAYDQAMEHAQQAGASELEGELAYNLRALLMDVGDLAGARWALDKAKAQVRPDLTMQARLQLAEGNLELSEGHPSLARLAFDQCLRLALQADDQSLAMKARLNLIDLDLARGDPAAAAARLARVEQDLGGPVSNPRTRTVLRLQAARIAVAQGRDHDALRALDSALAEDDVLPEWEWQLRHERGRLWAKHGDRSRARDELEAASAVVEALRGQLGLEAFKEGLLERRRGPLESLFLLELAAGSPQAALEVSERARARSFLDAIAAERDTRAVVVSRAGAVGNRLEELRRLWRRGASTGVVSTRPWAQVRGELGDVDVFAYFQAEDSWFVLAWREQALTITRLPRTAEEISGLVSDWRAQLDDLGRSRAVADAILPPDLLPPPGRPLVIVTDGVLGEVPFAALRRAGRFLVEDYVITHAPSFEILSRRLGPQAEDELGAPVVLGDAVADLPAAAAEAREVAVHLGVRAWLGEQVDRERLGAVADASLLHLATHGGLDDRGAWLQLADGKIHAFDLLAEQVAPRVAVVVSCASAVRRGRGLWGSIGAAFLAAGSRAVVATAWSVDDEATRRFVRSFYRARGESRPAVALATAQRTFIAAGEPISVWGAYVLLGAPVTDEERTP